MFLVVSALLLGAAEKTQANLLFWGFGLLIGSFAISVLVTFQTLRKIQVKRLLPSHAIANQQLLIRYHITNDSRLSIFNVSITENWGRGYHGYRKAGPIAQQPQKLKGQTLGWLLHLGPMQTIQAEAPAWPLQRGSLQFERINISSSFPFGIINKVIEFEQPTNILIYPTIYRMDRRLTTTISNTNPAGQKQIDRSGGHEEFFGLREYRPGDPIRMVDWKRTARTGNKVIREMTLPSPPRLMVQLDLRMDTLNLTEEEIHELTDELMPKPNESKKANTSKKQPALLNEDQIKEALVERAISLAASLVCDAYFHGFQVGLTFVGVNGPVLPVHHSLPHRTRILETLSSLDISTNGTANTVSNLEPAAIITTGRGKDATSPMSPQVLGAMDFKHYVIQSNDASNILSRRNAPTSKRQQHKSNLSPQPTEGKA
ncbi:DUF58 domain-containing protein [Poriferisphaera sp. WC338]|uniref:DUF58 domain-containing protein n=1 Tax=Poriferisphaera sp. WC338 TaxID=3425129 RepID=UPI003D813270